MKLRPCLLIVFGIFTHSFAAPVPTKSSAESELRRPQKFDAFSGDINNRQTETRTGRQGGFSYDYFAYPSENYYQPSYYPDYYGSYYDSLAYKPTRRPNINNSPVGYSNPHYPSRRKHDQRRKNVEANTQRWTVWDLARK